MHIVVHFYFPLFILSRYMKKEQQKKIFVKMNPRHRHRLNNKNNLTLGMKAVKFSLFFFNVIFLVSQIFSTLGILSHRKLN